VMTVQAIAPYHQYKNYRFGYCRSAPWALEERIKNTVGINQEKRVFLCKEFTSVNDQSKKILLSPCY